MKFKTRMINAAVAAALGTVAGAAQAVNLGNDGQGMVLIYPYYTVQNKGSTAFDTYISVVNSDSVNGKAVKVRFLEGKNSVEVLDFNLYLSPNDMWVGNITRNVGDANARLSTTDNSCTVPEIPPGGVIGATSTVPGIARWVSFVNNGYLGDLAKDDSLSRTREGYVEIISMADIQPGGVTDGAQGTPALNTYNASLHNSAGVPPNCAGIRAAWTPPFPGANDYNTPPNDGVFPPTGGLSGAATIINPNEGTDITYDAVAVDNFSAIALHFEPGSIQPQLSDVNPKNSAVFSGTDVVRTTWGIGILPPAMPVTALFMRNAVINEYAYAVGGPTAPTLGTDWVVNFPTKRLHLAEPAIANKLPFVSLTAGIGAPLTSTGACELTTPTAYNREEGVITTGLGFSPPRTQPGQNLCWEVNVISIDSAGGTISNVLNSNGGVLATTGIRMTLNPGFTEGWIRMAFAQARTAPVGSTVRTNIYTGLVGPATASVYTGLPMLGFSAVSFVNTSTVANYGGSYTHRYSRNINP